MTQAVVQMNDILAILKTIFDPEIPVNIVELGLIYDIAIDNKKVHIKMTLTNPLCPVAGLFPDIVKTQVESLSEVDEVIIDMVWDPPWSPEKMSEAAKLQLGLL
jgi:FeS assembly SUF system protein